MGISRFDIIQANSIIAPLMSSGAKVFYVSNATTGLPEGGKGGSDGNSGLSPLEPLATIDGAIGKCLAGRGDMILVLPSHAETVTAAITMDVAGVQLIGLKKGNQRPVITGNGAIDALTITAADCMVQGLHFAAPETDEQTAMINIAAADCVVRDITGVGSQTAKNVVDCFTLTSAANNCLIEDIWIENRVVAVNSFLSFEGAASTVRVKRFEAFGDVVTAGVIDAAAIDYLQLEDLQIAVVGTTKPAITLDSNPEGLARNCFFAGTHGTLATNANLGNLMRLDNIKVTEETNGSASAAIIPAVDVE